MRQNNLTILLIFYVFLSGCFARSHLNRDLIEQQATDLGFKRHLIQTPTHLLTSYQNFKKIKQPLIIYLEGDGRSWITRTRKSKNPTPLNPLALQLALLDPSANVAYLARPCQYTHFDQDPNCHIDVWTHQRFSPQVIASMNAAVDTLKQKAQASDVHLVGFSGGAAVAALIAEKRGDVKSLRTVAGDLNHVALSQHHSTTPLQNSLNPFDIASDLHSLPQRHFIGLKDTVIPVFVTQQFVDRVNSPVGSCAKITKLPKVGHQQGWTDIWVDLLQLPVNCQ